MRKIGLVLGIAVVLIATFAYKLYNKPHRDVAAEAFVAVAAPLLFAEFEKDEAAANRNYLDKVVQVSGTISEILTNQSGEVVFVLETDNPMFGVTCTMQGEEKDIAPGTQVTVRGICTGYLSDVVINRGILITQ